jgi:hypothetical protein
MAITVISRPLGHKLNTSAINAVIVDDGTGTARVYVSGGHSLQDGDYVYIVSNFDSYNGFKYVDSTAYDAFRIKNNAEDDAIEFVQEADVTFYVSVLNHGWQSVHLPIVYELESSLFPSNIGEETYTPITIVSVADYNGYTQINLSAALPGPPDELEYLELIGTGDAAGTHRILERLQPWSYVIDLAYNASFFLVTYQVVNYYNNYFILVRVYAGLNAAHRWEDEKPYEIAATLRLIPDDNNRVKFSINDILKGYINTRNNLTLDTLPNNLDFYTQFYISYSENYDIASGGTIAINEGSFTSDQDNFEGHAVNSMMPFKSLDESFMSDYINEDTLLANWLTLLQAPVMIAGRFFDLSFLNQYNGEDIQIIIDKRLNGLHIETEVIEIEEPGTGVIRVPIIPESGFDEYCIQALTVGQDEETMVFPSIATFLNVPVPNELDWTTGATPTVLLSAAADESSKSITGLYAFQVGKEYHVTVRLSSSASWAGTQITISFFNDSNTQVFSQIFTGITGSAGTSIERTTVYTPVALSLGTKVGVSVNRTPAGSGTSTYTFQTISGIADDDILGHIEITEQICCEVIEECSVPSVQNIALTWLNHLGGFEYFLFTARKDYGTNIEETGEQDNNIFTEWPKSYGSFADTIRRETFRRSRDFIIVRSQHVSKAKIEVLQTIKKSPLVQIINSRTDRRTVLVDTESFVKYTENDDTYSIQFAIRFTNENPSQKI